DRPPVVWPRRERQPSAGTADACELGCSRRVTGREDRAEHRDDHVEARVLVRHVLAVAFVEANLEALTCSRSARLGQLRGGEIEPDHLCAEAGSAKRHATRPAGNIQYTLTRLRRERSDHAVVDRRELLRDALVGGAAPSILALAHVRVPRISRYGRSWWM